jgi:threonine synthase
MGPEGAAALAGVEQAVARGAIPRDAKVVVVNTSSGLRYPHLVEIL